MPLDYALSRKEVLTSILAGIAGVALPTQALGQVNTETITLDDLKAAEKIAGFTLTDDERKEILSAVSSFAPGYASFRALPITESTGVPLAYIPYRDGSQPTGGAKAKPSDVKGLKRPKLDEEVAFLNIRELGFLIRSKQLTSVQLTHIYLDRLKKYGDSLLCLVTLTEALALQQAERADDELKRGIDRGPLHGIPYGAKDLFATKGIPTTWGAEPFKDQVFDYDAAAIERLRASGAVLVAKLSMGALAMGDVWFKGTTKNPWNAKQGSSGSSAGSSAAVAAGLIAFGIGTETSGSLMSPSLRCRVSGFRPTFGRISRFGAMELSFSLDRIGPLCRDVEDCALVLAAMAGSDARDASSVDRPFEYPAKVDMAHVRIGWVGAANGMDDDPAVKRLRALGATVSAVKVSPFPAGLFTILAVESGSAFDAFTRGTKIRELKDSTWPQTFRSSRYVPAVEYLQAQRARDLMVQTFEREFGDLDALLGPGIGGSAFSQANFGGYPSLMIPFGDDGNGNSVGKALIGRHYGEDRLLTIGKAIQDGFDFHRRHPDLTAI